MFDFEILCVLKCPFVLKKYGFDEITFLNRGIFHVGGKSGPTGWV